MYNNYCFQLVDTAGIRKKNKIKVNVELASTYFSRKEIRYANCVILVIDSSKGISTLDVSLSNYIIQEGRSILLVFNKWDLIDNKYEKMQEINNKIKNIFFDAKGITTLFICSKQFKNKNKVCEAIIDSL